MFTRDARLAHDGRLRKHPSFQRYGVLQIQRRGVAAINVVVHTVTRQAVATP